MSMTSDVLRAVANLLVTNGLGIYAEGSVATGSGPQIVMKKLPISGDRAIVLNLVTNDDNRAGGYSDVMLQVRTRGAKNDPFDPDQIADAIVPILNTQSRGLAAGTNTVVQLRRMTSVQNGQDDSGRYERIDQFYGQVSWNVVTSDS